MDKETPKQFLTSTYLKSCLNELWDDRTDSEKAHDEDWEIIMRDFVSSLEGFATPWANWLAETMKKSEDEWEMYVDDHYCKEFLGKVPPVVARFKRLSPVLVGKVPDQEITVYLREASRCYLYGFPQSSIALCRAALESGVNHVLERRLGSVSNQDLAHKIDQAARFNLIRHDVAYSAREIVRAANAVLHDKPATDDTAFSALALTRKVLQDVYARR